MTASERVFKRFKLRAPASLIDIEALEQHSQITLPASYRAFMLRHNGGEGFIGENYLALWPIETLLEHNYGFGTPEFLPWFFLIGSDGGGEGYGFDTRRATMPVVAVPFESLDQRYAVSVSESFNTFFDVFETAKHTLPKRMCDE